jgi:hypothetical protein
MAVKKTEEVKLPNNQEVIQSNVKPLNLKVRTIDGIQYLVHPVLITDTLSMLSLKYNVS